MMMEMMMMAVMMAVMMMTRLLDSNDNTCEIATATCAQIEIKQRLARV